MYGIYRWLVHMCTGPHVPCFVEPRATEFEELAMRPSLLKYNSLHAASIDDYVGPFDP